MTAAPVSLSSLPAMPRWGVRFREFLVVGGATLFLYPLSLLLQRVMGLDEAEYRVSYFAFYAAYVINDPHFAVTYLLFYRDVRARALGDKTPLLQRIRYVVAGFVVPVALIGWSLVALQQRSAQMLGWMVQLMYLLVGWHYVKQGFGVLTVLSARRGIRYSDRERWVFLAHCFSGWAFAWSSPAADAGQFEERGVVYWAIAHPRWLEIASGAVLAVTTLALVVVLVMRAWRERRLPAGPLVGYLVSIWAWLVFSSVDPLVRYIIPALHSIQYLFFVYLVTRNRARTEEGPPTFGPPPRTRLFALSAGALGLGFVLFHGAPELFDWAIPLGGPEELGATPIFAAIFVFVNVHHYFMDHVIWRRENPETRFLQDPPPRVAEATAPEVERAASAA